MGLKIAARSSDLAKLQAYRVADALKNKFPNEPIDFLFRESLGDKNLADPLWQMPEKGVFTEDFRQGLLAGEYDMVVHSWKDLPIDMPPETELAATLPRADMRDLFLFKKESEEQVRNQRRLCVYTSSPRRMYNLRSFFTDHLPFNIKRVEFKDVRGNIPTRLKKLFASDEVHGLVLAKAAWDRLSLSTEDEFAEVRRYLNECLALVRWMVLPLRINPNAAAQGALAVEIRSDRQDLKKKLQTINCQSTLNCVSREREILRSYGGGCHQKIGVAVLARDYGQLTFLRGEAESGEKIRQEELLTVPVARFAQSASFPHDPSAGSWFRRESVAFELPAATKHFVARANALPPRKQFLDSELVWVAGNKSWRKLAQKGIWVNGSTEGLGEHEDRRLEALEPAGEWIKWSHSRGVSDGPMKTIATYELRGKKEHPQLQGIKNIFWRSGSAFLAAVERQPGIVSAHHFCGPGNTYDIIKDYLQRQDQGGEVHIVLDYKHWAKTTWKGDQ